MLPIATVHKVRELLAEGEHSQRKIARLAGISRGSVNSIATGRRPDYEELKALQEDEWTEPSGPLVWCRVCRTKVQMPCQARLTRLWLSKHPQHLRMEDHCANIFRLELHPTERARYLEVRRMLRKAKLIA